MLNSVYPNIASQCSHWTIIFLHIFSNINMTVQLMAVQTTSPHTVEPEIGESKGLDLIWLHINTVYQRKKQTIESFLASISFRNW